MKNGRNCGSCMYRGHILIGKEYNGLPVYKCLNDAGLPVQVTKVDYCYRYSIKTKQTLSNNSGTTLSQV